MRVNGEIARLDEKSARRIAAGRLNALRERIDAAILRSKNESRKPEVRARAIQESMQRTFGELLLGWGRTGRNLVCEFAQPGEKAGWVDIFVAFHNLRSLATKVVLLAQLSAHATARVLERRRDVDIERLLAEELQGAPFDRLMDAWLDNEPGEVNVATTNGQFRFKRNGERTLIAVTWIATKPD